MAVFMAPKVNVKTPQHLKAHASLNFEQRVISGLHFQDTREITGMFLVFDFLRTVVFLSKLWEAILCVDKLPENATTDKLNTNMCVYYGN